MSWSIHAEGNPTNIVKALEAEGARVTGPSKDDVALVLPHLVGLVNTFSRLDPTSTVLKVKANTSSYEVDGKPHSHHFNISIKARYAGKEQR